jgi:hypothetical protein
MIIFLLLWHLDSHNAVKVKVKSKECQEDSDNRGYTFCKAPRFDVNTDFVE